MNNILTPLSQDPFFQSILHDLKDYGFKIKPSFFGRAGAYQPFALATEALDTPEKYDLFMNGFWRLYEAGGMRAEMKISRWIGRAGQLHTLMHEMMHFYCDMHGLYLIPLKEQGELTPFLDARSEIVCTLFNEAFAQVEAIRGSYRLQEQGDNIAWQGALASPDWSALAKAYAADLQSGKDEAQAAARCMKAWYENTRTRSFYEAHGLKVFKINEQRICADISKEANVSHALRKAEIPMLFIRLPKEGMPEYLTDMDWSDPLYHAVQTPKVAKEVDLIVKRIGQAQSDNLQEIKCGSAPYLWKRLSQEANHPPMSFDEHTVELG